MRLERIPSANLIWHFDFGPRNPWPSFMPALAVLHQEKFTAVAGFDRRNHADLNFLILDTLLVDTIERLYPQETLAPLESLRLQFVLGKRATQKYLLDLPRDFQDFLDQRAVPLKSLKPLEQLGSWTKEIAETFFKLKPSASQVREILDILCDLKFQKGEWPQVLAENRDAQEWTEQLKRMRFPKTAAHDDRNAQLVTKTPWPRGVQAKWDRQGDQGGILIQTKITNPREWENLKENLRKIDLKDDIWIP